MEKYPSETGQMRRTQPHRQIHTSYKRSQGIEKKDTYGF